MIVANMDPEKWILTINARKKQKLNLRVISLERKK